MDGTTKILLGLWMGVCLTSSTVFISAGYTTPARSNLAITAPPKDVEQSTKGVWKKDNEGRWNFYCSEDGSYQGHVTYMDAGFWNTYEGDESRGTYIDLVSAKHYIEKKIAKCN